MWNWIGHKFSEGGYDVMFAILGVLCMAIVVVVWKSLKYYGEYSLSADESFMGQIQKFIMSNSIENAIRVCKGPTFKKKLVAQVVKEGLKRANDSADEIANSIDRAVIGATAKVNTLINFLGTLANVATLLGLLGTLKGLIKSFGAAGSSELDGGEKQKILAEGISEALVATTFGLSAALFCLLMFGVLQLRQNKINVSIAKAAAALNELLYTRKMKLKRGR